MDLIMGHFNEILNYVSNSFSAISYFFFFLLMAFSK